MWIFKLRFLFFILAFDFCWFKLRWIIACTCFV